MEVNSKFKIVSAEREEVWESEEHNHSDPLPALGKIGRNLPREGRVKEQH
jgi:hypothetical protein